VLSIRTFSEWLVVKHIFSLCAIFHTTFAVKRIYLKSNLSEATNGSGTG